ncbi:MAG: tRNA (N(6)-L-threonylcarbamoyladenosine(37)-C(2))-methylthiotransferase MtaB [Gemmataceae bacterium]
MSDRIPNLGLPSSDPAGLARPRRFRTVTLGCKVNQYETQYAQELLENAGWQAAEPEEPADLCLVNTCTVTHEADVKARNLIRRLHRQQPGAEIVVMGCYATRAPGEIGQIPGVSLVVTDKDSLAQDLQPWGVTDSLPGIRGFAGHQRALVKVQDGCLLDCAYCIIPTVRPRFSSRPIDDIVSEVAGLVATGYHEIVLGGIHLGHYGLDLSKGKPREQWSRLWHLLERLETLPGEFRIRLSSLDAAEARESLLKVIAANRRVVPHLHLCLQSGSDQVLTSMRRRYTASRFLEQVAMANDLLDQPAITTDLIVGYPCETEADFEASCAVARQAGFAGMHLFAFSAREGTRAATLPDPVPAKVIHDRMRRAAEVEASLADSYRRSLVGRDLEVLVETADEARPGHVQGTACRGVRVTLRGLLPALRRKLVPVRAIGVEGDVVVGEPVAEGRALSGTRANPLPLPVSGIRVALPVY